MEDETKGSGTDSGGADLDQEPSEGAEIEDDSLPVRIVNRILFNAIDAGASDIHIEPFEDRVRVRFRVNGILQEHDSLDGSIHKAVVSRIKVISQMKLDEVRLPQDQRTRLRMRGRFMDFRVSTVPTFHGERVVLRILDKQNLSLDLRNLGFEDEPLGRLLQALTKPFGMILITGPSGSGKTTTLYGALQILNTPEVNILTAEEPVEYELDGIGQVHCRPQIGLTFANVLRCLLRQDPDVIMVGEIRDRETADVAVKAALTGHLVLSQLYADSSASCMHRLLDMGVEPFMVASSVILATAQRLFKKLCESCKEPWTPPEGLLREWGIVEPVEGVSLFRAKGCPKCHKGYRGRLASMEALVIDETVKDLIIRREFPRDIRKIASMRGMKTLREYAMTKVLRGLTTREEVLRATTD